ncbi:hypothetical protein Glove_58g73 [Diversispora epigaea]|uniref:Uncharacterized protein n=1 Tax=Diversispora epigaea TaxID=1348612 RepID=A0A397JGG8_9GLOM|nr:hypothetical protein Glove_58g73 [Diversispora epigaea]
MTFEFLKKLSQDLTELLNVKKKIMLFLNFSHFKFYRKWTKEEDEILILTQAVDLCREKTNGGTILTLIGQSHNSTWTIEKGGSKMQSQYMDVMR